MKRSEIAVQKFKDGFNCAQSVLFGFSDLLNVSSDEALKMATGFGGGMGRSQHVCGAISGGILAINLMYGRGENEPKEKQDIAYTKTRQLIEAFEKEHNTIACLELLDGSVLLTEEGQKRFKEENMIERCRGYVGRVVELVEGLIEQ